MSKIEHDVEIVEESLMSDKRTAKSLVDVIAARTADGWSFDHVTERGSNYTLFFSRPAQRHGGAAS